MNVRVILLGHQARVGKDTVADFLVANKRFKKLSFANKLKTTVKDLYSFSDSQVFGDDKDQIDSRYNLSPRQILQDFGQEQRVRYEDIWVQYVSNQIIQSVHNKEYLNFVISDFRFPNEYGALDKMLKKNLEYVRVIPVKIIRPDIKDFAGMNDISETALNDFQPWDLILKNNSTIENLHKNFELQMLSIGLPL
jgi:hypothetical protein